MLHPLSRECGIRWMFLVLTRAQTAFFGSSWIMLCHAHQLVCIVSCIHLSCSSPMLDMGFCDIIRRVRLAHKSCRDAGTAALRDMGVDDYKC